MFTNCYPNKKKLNVLFCIFCFFISASSVNAQEPTTPQLEEFCKTMDLYSKKELKEIERTYAPNGMQFRNGSSSWSVMDSYGASGCTHDCDLASRMPETSCGEPAKYTLPVVYRINSNTCSGGAGIPTQAELDAFLEGTNDYYNCIGLPIELVKCTSYDMSVLNAGSVIQADGSTVSEPYPCPYDDSPTDIPNVLNIYVLDDTNPDPTKGTGCNGFAYLPLGSAPEEAVMSNACYSGFTLPASPDCSNLNWLPPVFIHEVGHYLGLYHTHETGVGSGADDPSTIADNCTGGDLIADTDSDPDFSGNEPNFTGCVHTLMSDCSFDSANCGAYGTPNTLNNIMSYNQFSGCRFEYTDCQKAKMIDALLCFRNNMVCCDATIADTNDGSLYFTSGETVASMCLGGTAPTFMIDNLAGGATTGDDLDDGCVAWYTDADTRDPLATGNSFTPTVPATPGVYTFYFDDDVNEYTTTECDDNIRKTVQVIVLDSPGTATAANGTASPTDACEGSTFMLGTSGETVSSSSNMIGYYFSDNAPNGANCAADAATIAAASTATSSSFGILQSDTGTPLTDLSAFDIDCAAIGGDGTYFITPFVAYGDTPVNCAASGNSNSVNWSSGAGGGAAGPIGPISNCSAPATYTCTYEIVVTVTSCDGADNFHLDFRPPSSSCGGIGFGGPTEITGCSIGQTYTFTQTAILGEDSTFDPLTSQFCVNAINAGGGTNGLGYTVEIKYDCVGEDALTKWNNNGSPTTLCDDAGDNCLFGTPVAINCNCTATCDPVTNVTCSNPTATTMDISWTAPATAPTGYTVQASCDGGTNWNTIQTATMEHPWMNEIHYDSDEVDQGVEIAGPAGLDLTCYTLHKYNGANGLEYGSARVLTGLIDDETNMNTGMNTGFGALWFTYNLQNGPDGIALVYNGDGSCDCPGAEEVVQFISYEGTPFTAVDGPANGLSSVVIGVNETNSTLPSESLQLSGCGDAYADFGWNAPAQETKGDLNTGQQVYLLETTMATAINLDPCVSYDLRVLSNCCGEESAWVQTAASCTTMPPTITTMDASPSICSGGFATELADWQASVNTAAMNDCYSVIFSTILSGDAGFPSADLSAITGTQTGCTSANQMAYAYQVCDPDKTANSSDEAYQLAGTFTLTVYPDIQAPTVVTNGCVVTVTGACTGDLVTLSSQTVGTGTITNNGTNVATYTAAANDAAGMIDVDITSGVVGSTCTYTTTMAATPLCPATPMCPATQTVDGTAASVCNAVTNEVTTWQTAVAATDGTGAVVSAAVSPVTTTIIYSSNNAYTVTDFPSSAWDAAPNGMYTGDNCTAETENYYAYVICDLTGDGETADDMVTLVGTIGLTIYPNIQAPTVVTNGCVVTVTGACSGDLVTLSNQTIGTGTIINNGTNIVTYTAAASDAAGMVDVDITSGVVGSTCTYTTTMAATPLCPANPAAPMISITDPCECNDNATTLTVDASGNVNDLNMDGTGNSDGTFSETVSVTYDADDATAGVQYDSNVGWRVLTITSQTTGTTTAPTTSVGTILTDNMDGTYEVAFNHTSGTGFTIVVEAYDKTTEATLQNAGVDITATISNTCSYPEITFAAMPTTLDACAGSTLDLTTLTDPDTDVTFNGTNVTGTTFDAAAAGESTGNMITVTINPADAAAGMSQDGDCLQSYTISINVIACPSACGADNGTLILSTN